MSSLPPSLLGLQKKFRKRVDPSVDALALGTIPQPVFLEQGVVTGTDPGPPLTVTVQLGGSSTDLAGVFYNANLTPTIGMGVWVLRAGNDLLVLCTLA